MNFLLCIHTTYNTVDCALAQDNKILVESTLHKEQASAQLIPTINALISVLHLQLADISHIIVNQGPAPFTTLRTIIATANGIAFAYKIPLIGVDALDACLQEYTQATGPTVVLLNAFNKAVYYGVTDPVSNHAIKGYAPIETCMEMIKQLFPYQSIYFIGNGSELYRSELKTYFGNQVCFQDPLPLTASLRQILSQGTKQLLTGKNISQFIEPLYLKKPVS